MVKSHRTPSCLFIFIFISLVVSSLGDEPTDLIKSCLTVNHVTNFTIFPNSKNESSLTYYHLLYFSIQNLRFTEPTFSKPTAIVLPETKEQLVGTVLCSRQASLALRIRCGGHSYEGLSSTAAAGTQFVIIDMMNLNKVSIDLESEMAWVEGGATLGETYYAISESSKLYGFSAGSCPWVGSGGHFAGGGFGFLSRKYGIAADNVVDAVLVDADGRLLDRKAMGKDVFWAIRGGGGGVWGIVYAWKIRLLRVPQVVTTFQLSRSGTEHSVAELVHKWQFVGPNLEDEFYLSLSIGAGASSCISAAFNGLYLGSKTEAISTMNQVFPELGIVEEDCKEMSWIESVLFFSGLGNQNSISDLKDRYWRNKVYFKAKSDYVKVPISMRGIKSALKILEKEHRGYVFLDPYGGMMGRISSDSIPFPHREGNLFMIQYFVEWNEESNGESTKFIDWIRRFYNSMTYFVLRGPRAAYVNYLDLDLGVMNLLNGSSTLIDAVEVARVWGEKYFLKNYDRLVRAKTLIDPNNVFNNPQGIPPMSTD